MYCRNLHGELSENYTFANIHDVHVLALMQYKLEFFVGFLDVHVMQHNK